MGFNLEFKGLKGTLSVTKTADGSKSWSHGSCTYNILQADNITRKQQITIK
jgi:hypothetical protein